MVSVLPQGDSLFLRMLLSGQYRKFRSLLAAQAALKRPLMRHSKLNSYIRLVNTLIISKLIQHLLSNVLLVKNNQLHLILRKINSLIDTSKISQKF